MSTPPKIDPDLLAQAQAGGVDVEAVIDAALRAAVGKLDTAVADAKAAKWAKDSADAMAEYRRRVKDAGDS